MKKFVPVSISVVLLLISSVCCMPDGSLRLVNGPSEFEGRVEVYYDGEWGTICDDSFQYGDANVICRQLGYESAAAIYYRARYGEGTGPIWLDQLACTSSHESILDCRHNGWGIHDCQHREDAGVRCRRKNPVKPATMPIRLVCPACNPEGSCMSIPVKSHPGPQDCDRQIACEGLVQASYNGVWHPVTAKGFNDAAARVVCGELGYPYAVASPSVDELWKNWDASISDLVGESGAMCNIVDIFQDTSLRHGLSFTWLKRLSCLGTESRLLNCYFSEFGPNEITPDLDATTPPRVATVRCGFNPHTSCLDKDIEHYRTRGSSINSQGRIEVYYGGEWGTICDRQFDIPDASVACRSMGYGSAKLPANYAYYGRGAGKIHFTQLKCTGSELYISDCEHLSGRYAQSCGHSADAGVICNHPTESQVVPISRLLDVPHPQNPAFISPFVEINGPQGSGLYCYFKSQLSLKAARVMCRSDKEQYEYRIRSGDHPDYTGPRYLGSIECTGDEDTINECSVQLRQVGRCAFGETVVDCSPTLPDLVPDLDFFQRSLHYYPYIDRLPIYYLTCALTENCLSSSAYGQPLHAVRHLLRFGSRTMNFGRVDFRPTTNPAEWEYHDCHRHYHSYEAFIHYDLLNATTREKVAQGHKASFCLEDSSCEPGYRARFRCGTGSQGISVNCGDVYGRHLDCQWIDITDLASDRAERYIVSQRVNPDQLGSETDFVNNNMECSITIYPGFYLSVESCKYSDQ